MTIDARSSLILLATLLLGIAIGALGAGAVAQRRSEHIRELRMRGMFVDHMEQIIRPRDQAQWEAIRPIVEATGRRNYAIMDSTHIRLEAEMGRMREALAPHLDEAQRGRMEAAAHFRGVFGPHPHRPLHPRH
ncbi:MAG TPA: hypothetical protein VFG78_00130 [Gemmatimonadota bacterium]|nr:hypothetical protein [Gemmatimonadota bacterium]